MSRDEEDYSNMMTTKIKEIARTVACEEIERCPGTNRALDLERRITVVESDFKTMTREIYNEIKAGNKEQESKWFQVLLLFGGCALGIIVNIAMQVL